jgi:hypothetical protein
MNKAELLNLVRPTCASDGFGNWALATVDAIADGIVASGFALSAKSVVGHLETQCEALQFPGQSAGSIANRIAAIRAHERLDFTKRAACLLPTLMGVADAEARQQETIADVEGQAYQRAP